MGAARHRFNYIHPFPDGNERVSRLMSHAMAWQADVAAHGLWSISRGLARGVERRTEYKQMMDLADTPRQGALDGRGGLSERALIDFVAWFLSVALEQVTFMSELFVLDRRRQSGLRAHQGDAGTAWDSDRGFRCGHCGARPRDWRHTRDRQP